MHILTSPPAVKLIWGVLSKCFHGKVFSVMTSVTRKIVFPMNFIHKLGFYFIEITAIGITFRGGKAFRATVVMKHYVLS